MQFKIRCSKNDKNLPKKIKRETKGKEKKRHLVIKTLELTLNHKSKKLQIRSKDEPTLQALTKLLCMV